MTATVFYEEARVFNVWLMNLRAQPPTIVAQARSADRDTLAGIAADMAARFPGPEFTLVHEVDAEPIGVTEIQLKPADPTLEHMAMRMRRSE